MAYYKIEEQQVFSSSKEKFFHIGIPIPSNYKATDFFFERMNVELEYLSKQIFLYRERKTIEMDTLYFQFEPDKLKALLPRGYKQDLHNDILHISSQCYQPLRDAIISTYKEAIEAFLKAFMKYLFRFERFKTAIKQQITDMGLKEPFSIVKTIDCFTIHPVTLYQCRIVSNIKIKMGDVMTLEDYKSTFKMGGLTRRQDCLNLSESLSPVSVEITLM